MEKKEKTSETGKEDKTKQEQVNKKEEKTSVAKKTAAIVRGTSLSISLKHSMAICKFIKGKELDRAVSELEKVLNLKLSVPMKGEIPHRKGMKSGRYPINASSLFIKLLKSVNANALQHGLEKPYQIVEAYANKASQPVRRGGAMRAKRTHILIKIKKMEKKI